MGQGRGFEMSSCLMEDGFFFGGLTADEVNGVWTFVKVMCLLGESGRNGE